MLAPSLVIWVASAGTRGNTLPRPQQTSLQPRRDHWLDCALEPSLLHSWWGYTPRYSPRTPGLSQCTGRLLLLLCCRHHGAEIYCLALTVTIQLCLCKSTWYSCCGWPHHLVPCIQAGDADGQLIQVSDDMGGGAAFSLVVQGPGVGSQQSFMLATVRSVPIPCQKVRTSREALTSRASLLGHSYFLSRATFPTHCSAWSRPRTSVALPHPLPLLHQ